MVIDLFGKIKDGTIIGDNLGNSIMTKTGTGIAVDGQWTLQMIEEFNKYAEEKGSKVRIPVNR